MEMHDINGVLESLKIYFNGNPLQCSITEQESRTRTRQPSKVAIQPNGQSVNAFVDYRGSAFMVRCDDTRLLELPKWMLERLLRKMIEKVYNAHPKQAIMVELFDSLAEYLSHFHGDVGELDYLVDVGIPLERGEVRGSLYASNKPLRIRKPRAWVNYSKNELYATVPSAGMDMVFAGEVEGRISKREKNYVLDVLEHLGKMAAGRTRYPWLWVPAGQSNRILQKTIGDTNSFLFEIYHLENPGKRKLVFYAADTDSVHVFMIYPVALYNNEKHWFLARGIFMSDWMDEGEIYSTARSVARQMMAEIKKTPVLYQERLHGMPNSYSYISMN